MKVEIPSRLKTGAPGQKNEMWLKCEDLSETICPVPQCLFIPVMIYMRFKSISVIPSLLTSITLFKSNICAKPNLSKIERFYKNQSTFQNTVLEKTM